MLCIHLKNTDPFYCLAAEEYFMKNFSEDIFMLWQSKDTLVVGKHQNALAEMNYPYVRKADVKVARRISGGGTVFHDAGNVNFTFIKNVKSPAEISFKQFTLPIVETLAELDVLAVSSGRNDLLVEGFKISGNAEHVYKNRVLHHGTLLFDADLSRLGEAIKVVPETYKGKAVQSNRSKVANISLFLQKEMTTEKFIDFLLTMQLKKKVNALYRITSSDIESIQELATKKFKTWEWNYGYSPKYSFQKTTKVNNRTIRIQLTVKKGLVQTCQLEGSYFSAEECKSISAQIIGKRHFYEDIKSVLNTNSQELIYSFF